MSKPTQAPPAWFLAKEHKLRDDASAIVFCALITALGLFIYKEAGLVTGGIAGLALLTSYALPVSVGAAFFVLNIPFYIFGLLQRGWGFVARTAITITLVSFLVDGLGHYVSFAKLSPLVAAVFGGLCIGFGLLSIFRHNASLGGVSIMSIHIQDRYGFSAGLSNLIFDVLLLSLAFIFASWQMVLISILGALVTNLMLGLHHRTDRYIGVSSGKPFPKD